MNFSEFFQSVFIVMVMILLPPLPLLSAAAPRHSHMNPSIQNSSRRRAAFILAERAADADPSPASSRLICAVPSSMPDKSMCQHLFLCCQFFMVFDDISPIVSPATHAVVVASGQFACCPMAHLVKSPWSWSSGRTWSRSRSQ